MKTRSKPLEGDVRLSEQRAIHCGHRGGELKSAAPLVAPFVPPAPLAPLARYSRRRVALEPLEPVAPVVERVERVEQTDKRPPTPTLSSNPLEKDQRI